MNFIYMYILFTSLTEPSILFQESYELLDRIFSFWNIFIANKNNHFDILVHVKFQFRSVLLDLFNSWEAYNPHSLRYTVIFLLSKNKLCFPSIWCLMSKWVILNTPLNWNYYNPVNHFLQHGTCALFTPPPPPPPPPPPHISPYPQKVVIVQVMLLHFHQC